MTFSLGYTLLILVIYVLAVARVTRLVNYDTVLDPLRLWIARRAGAAKLAAAEAEESQVGLGVLHLVWERRMARWNTLAYFLNCPWCVGFWISLVTAVVPVWIVGWPWWALFGVALATSHLVGVAAVLSADEDIEIVADGG